jgi:hypothetical protein
VGAGLGVNPTKTAGRRTARIMHSMWESAILYFGKSAEEVAQVQEAEAEKADRREEASRLTMSEIEAGKAAFLAGISLDDAILTKTGRIGWKGAERDYRNGYRLYGSGLDLTDANRAIRAGYEAARVEAAIAGMVTL